MCIHSYKESRQVQVSDILGQNENLWKKNDCTVDPEEFACNNNNCSSVTKKKKKNHLDILLTINASTS